MNTFKVEIVRIIYSTDDFTVRIDGKNNLEFIRDLGKDTERKYVLAPKAAQEYVRKLQDNYQIIKQSFNPIASIKRLNMGFGFFKTMTEEQIDELKEVLENNIKGD